MRLALKSTLSFLLVYLVIVGGVAWWMAIQLQSLASDMAESTTQLVGGEVARALSDSAVAQLVRADDDTRARLKQIVDDVTQHSSLLTSVAVVDRVAVLADQHIIASGPLSEVARLPHPFVRNFFLGHLERCAEEDVKRFRLSLDDTSDEGGVPAMLREESIN